MENALRNVAIIAHVDHGKTTLVDALFRESGLFGSRQDQAERILDRNDLEGVRINLIDTPGHADFGGQVERVLTMADGALVLVDAFEGPRAQTRFVLEKALQNHLSILVVVNKMDRRDARPREVLDEMFDLLVDLGAEDLAVDFPVLYASAREGWAALKPDPGEPSMAPLLDRILQDVPAPACGDGPLLFQVSTLDWDAYTGKMGIGRVQQGRLQRGMEVSLVRAEGPPVAGRIKEIYRFNGMERVPTESVGPGDIAVVAGMEELGLGDTLCHPDHLQALSPIRVEKPTIEMEVRINESPFAGREGEHVTARKVQERLRRAGLSDPALKVELGPEG
ncbi:MAG: GTP-binding protein, partial [Nitrospinota bacterium]